eukprot:8729036-Pyramimonas_sp.AAC.1
MLKQFTQDRDKLQVQLQHIQTALENKCAAITAMTVDIATLEEEFAATATAVAPAKAIGHQL